MEIRSFLHSTIEVPKIKGVSVNILVLLGSLIISVLVLEIGLRTFTLFPIHGWRNLQPHPLLGYTLSSKLSDVDREGFRNPPGISQKILAIGDSHTEGYNVHYEDSWPARFSSKINSPVYNAGIGGYSILNYGVLLANLPPDVREIILGVFVANDFDKFTEYSEYAVTQRGRETIERTFGVMVPIYAHQKRNKGIRTRLKENSAIVSAIEYWIERYRGKDLLKKPDIAKKYKGLLVHIDGVPVGLTREIERHNSITDRTNPQVAERVEFFITLLRQFKEIHRDVALKILMLPSKELVLHSAELTCPRTASSGVVLHEIDLKNYLMKTLRSAGFQVEDALSFVLEQYCHSSNEERDAFYPPLDGHPFAGGYEAYARAAFELHFRH